MADVTTGNVSPTQANPYGLPPSLMALMTGLQGLSTAMQPGGVGSSQYMRPAPGAVWSQGGANSLLQAILQMRNAATQGLADPYQAGVGMPRVSLLG